MAVFQRKDGRWVAEISIGPRGARQAITRYAKTQSEAEAKHRELIVEYGLTRADRFWAKVDKSECWLWKGTTIRGYGYFGSPRKRAHRVAWELAEGPVPDGLYVLHNCDTKACVRPSHLRLGTHADNMRDYAERGPLLSP